MAVQILLKENNSWQSPPYWSFAQPTPLMEQKGLSWGVLRETVKKVNSMARRTFNAQYSKAHVWKTMFYIGIAIVFMALLVILVSALTSSKTAEGEASVGVIWGVFLCFLSVVLMIVCQCMVSKTYSNAVESAENAVRLYVERTLNMEWQSSRGIRWSIETKQIVTKSSDGDGNTTTSTTTLYHIGIVCVQSAKEAADQQRHVEPAAPPAHAPNNYGVPAGQDEVEIFVPKQYSEGPVTDQ